jgi:ATP-binding cassette subfamily F protein 3
LDIDSIQWLEDYLATFGGGVLVISHDRIFLDRVTNRTLDLSLGKIYDYKVGFSEYVKLKEERIEHQSASYENQQKMIRDTEKFIERFRYKATKAVQVQSRVKQLDKLDRIEVEQEDRLSMHLRFPVAKRSGKIVMEIDHLSKSYGDNEVLKDIDMVIQRGEKVAFVGRNGEGKTTLSRIIVGELDYRGGFRLGHNVELGYFAQNQDELMDENKTVLETVDAVAVGDIRTKMRDILGAFLFRGEDVDKKVKVLSGGERSRLAMAVMILQPFNLLILDEPTNHLDMNSKDILKNALLQYDGTLIVVSHDREFLDGLVDKVYEFRNKGIREYIGGIFEFLDKRKIRSIREIERRGTQSKPATPSGEGSKKDYQEKKAFERKLRKHERAVKELEDAIAASEKEISEMDRIMADPDNIEDQSLFFSYREKRNELDRLMERWERASADLEQLKGS